MARTGSAQDSTLRNVTKTYTKEEGCVSKTLKQLNWPTLEVAELTLMYKCVTNQAAIDIPCYMYNISLP